MNNTNIPVERLIIYRFSGKDGKQIEKVFDIPNGNTSYSFTSLLVSLRAHLSLEFGHNNEPDIEEVRISHNGDITYVDAVEKPRLQIYALNYNIIRVPGCMTLPPQKPLWPWW